MDILIDTCSWLKIDSLIDEHLFSAKILYDFASINITHDVVTELEHYHAKSWIKEKTKIIPIKDKRIFDEAIVLEFDTADASILSNGSKDASWVIVSEDHLLLECAQLYNLKAMQLIDLMKVLVNQEVISKNILFKINRFCRKARNITEKREKQVKQWLQENGADPGE